MLGILLAAVIELTGVTGSDMRSRAFFDANNVKVGDPLILTIDFLGEAEFFNLHPPALAKFVNRRDWKVDDKSSKTDTFRDARRLIYRVRPMRDGVLIFPMLEFGYVDREGRHCVVRSNEIPVHARVGAQVVVDELSDSDENGYPKPPELIAGRSRDFAWKKALSKPTADAFTHFDTVEGRMNEATCAIREGNWARAMKIYRILEWRIGQTPEIEKGIVAALALRYENPNAELPVWREVLRPLLRHNWKWRVMIVGGSLMAMALVFWIIGKCIRVIAGLALALLLMLPQSAEAQDIFQQMEEQMQRMRQQMNQMMGGGFSMSIGGERQPAVEILATLEMSKKSPRVGENFDFIVNLEAPKTASIGQIRLSPSETIGLKVMGDVRNLADGKSRNPSNVVKRLAVPVRYEVPFNGRFAFAVDGIVSGRNERGGRGSFVVSFSNSFHTECKPIEVKIRPLDSAGQPPDYTGIVSDGLRIHETCDLIRVGTNDVVTITYRMYPKGYVPQNFLPPGAAFEWTRDERTGVIEYRRYFVASGTNLTPRVSIPYYDPRTGRYFRAETVPTRLFYVP